MIPQILADTGRIINNRYPQAEKMLLGAHAGQHQQLRRSYRSGAEDDLISFQGEDLSAAFHFHADGSVPIEYHPSNRHVGPDGQIEAVALRIELA